MLNPLRTSGPATILDSGEVTCFGGHDLRLAIDQGPLKLELEWQFVDDPDQPGASVDTVELPHGYRFTCRNFDGPDGRGSALPVYLGKLGDNAILMHFRVFRWGRSPDRTLHYTFYRVPASDP